VGGCFTLEKQNVLCFPDVLKSRLGEDAAREVRAGFLPAGREWIHSQAPKVREKHCQGPAKGPRGVHSALKAIREGMSCHVRTQGPGQPGCPKVSRTQPTARRHYFRNYFILAYCVLIKPACRDWNSG